MQTVADCTNNLYIPVLRKKVAQEITDDDATTQTVNEKSWFGSALATDNNGYRLVAGADKQSIVPQNEIVSGEATAYQYNTADHKWERKGAPFISPDILSALSGTTGVRSVAIDQDTVIMGMPHLIHRGTSFSSGGAAIYKWSGSYWKNAGYASDNYPTLYVGDPIPTQANIPPIIGPPEYKASGIGSSVTLNGENHAAVGNSMRNEVALMKNRDIEFSEKIIVPAIYYLLH